MRNVFSVGNFVVLFFVLAIVGTIGFCVYFIGYAGIDWRAWNYGVEKMDHGYIPEGYDLYHIGSFEDFWGWNEVELDGHPEREARQLNDCWDGPFGWDADHFTDMQRRVMYNNYHSPNRWWEAGPYQQALYMWDDE